MKKVRNFNEQLFDAVKEKLYEKVCFLVALGADVKHHDEQFRTYLMFCDDVKIAKFLIDNGVDVNAVGNGAQTALGNTKNIDVAKLLIENGANLEVCNCYEQNILMNAIIGMNAPKAMLLIESGANVRARDKYGNSVLRFAVDRDMVDLAEIIINKGADVDDFDNKFRKSLWWNVKSVEMAKLLLRYKTPIEGVDMNGNSNLYPLIYEANVEAVSELLRAGIDVNRKNKDGDNVLMIALNRDKTDEERYANDVERFEKNKKIVKGLLKSGVDVLARNNKGQTALRIAGERMRKFIINELKSMKKEALLFEFEQKSINRG